MRGTEQPTCGSAGIEVVVKDRETRLATLLDRMQRGDRCAAALFIVENSALIRRRFRKRISTSVRQIFDSQDLVSTLARRLDRIVLRGALRAESVGELWSLVMAMGKFSLNEHVRDATAKRDFRAPDTIRDPQGAEAQRAPGEREGDGLGLLDRCLRRLNDDVDATILVLRLAGLSHAHIAEHLGMSVGAARKRWERIRECLGGLEIKT